MNNMRAESALLLIGCLMAAEKGGWPVKAASHDRLSEEGFEAALASKNPKRHMQVASLYAKQAIAAAKTENVKTLLNAAALSVLLLTLEKKLGSVPEIVLTALSIVLDPVNGAALQDRDVALDQFARAFAMREALEQSAAIPAGALQFTSQNP
jgi:hypothetical protein